MIVANGCVDGGCGRRTMTASSVDVHVFLLEETLDHGGLDAGDANPRPLRTADVARQAGRSVQQVRNLERDGVLEPTARTPSGYRTWTEAHARAAATYVALASAAGHDHARRARARRRGTRPPTHRDVELARGAAAAIGAEPFDDIRPDDAMTISELAAALAVPTST
ncbi:hypothetical protein ABT369_13120 [Dactylosporangium sp. NPDC000244]|uniref:hypothetical protein n=1 Tax=Dactylosporangium sp. NPDC000244 TaxID=3154365 RepID=UPI003317AB56